MSLPINEIVCGGCLDNELRECCLWCGEFTVIVSEQGNGQKIKATMPELFQDKQ